MRFSLMALMVAASVVAATNGAKIELARQKSRLLKAARAKRSLVSTDLIANAQTCLSTCSDCASLWSIVAKSPCSSYFASLDVSMDSSDGDSLGVVALMAGADAAPFTERVCNSFKSDVGASTCVAQAPLDSIIQTIQDNSAEDEICNSFITSLETEVSTIIEAMMEYQESVDSFVPTESISASQVEIINDQMDAFFDELGENLNQTNLGTTLAYQLSQVDMSWGQVLATVFGFTEEVSVCLGTEDDDESCTDFSGQYVDSFIKLFLDSDSSDLDEYIGQLGIWYSACALSIANATQNGNPYLLNDNSCFLADIFSSSNGEAFQATLEDVENFPDALYAMEDSMGTLIESCNEVDVDVVTTFSPTATPTTASPTTTTLNPASTSAPQLLLILVAMLFARYV